MVFSVDLEATGTYEFAIASLRSETEDGTYSEIVVYTLQCSGKWAVGMWDGGEIKHGPCCYCEATSYLQLQWLI